MSTDDGSPSVAEVRSARKLLKRYLPITPVVPATGLARRLGGSTHLKLEGTLPTGSFKPRGALCALASRLESGPVPRVVASSTGNHGAAVAWAARAMSVPATIFLPRGANPVKRARIERLGARIVEAGRDLSDAAAAARAFVEREEAYYLNDATDPVLPAGPATIGCEILEQLPEAREIWVPIGDTALIRGVARATKALRPEIRIVGVQAAEAPSYYLSWKEGRVVATETCDTIADGLATRTPHPPNVRAIRELVDDVVLVTEEEMLRAVRHLLLEEHVVTEPAGAATTAALLAAESAAPGTVLLVTGANLSLEVLRQVVAVD